jgi:hypothetical protein
VAPTRQLWVAPTGCPSMEGLPASRAPSATRPAPPSNAYSRMSCFASSAFMSELRSGGLSETKMTSRVGPSDYLSDNRDAHRRTLTDADGLCGQVNGRIGAGHRRLLSAWGSRGRGFKSRRPDQLRRHIPSMGVPPWGPNGDQQPQGPGVNQR